MRPRSPTSRKYSTTAKKPESMLRKFASLRNGLTREFRKEAEAAADPVACQPPGDRPDDPAENVRAQETPLVEESAGTFGGRVDPGPSAAQVPSPSTGRLRRAVLLESRVETAAIQGDLPRVGSRGESNARAACQVRARRSTRDTRPRSEGDRRSSRGQPIGRGGSSRSRLIRPRIRQWSTLPRPPGLPLRSRSG